MIKEKGYVIFFRDRKVLFMPRGYSLKSTVALGVREINLYRLKASLCKLWPIVEK
jgi:hypothetical protein